MDATKLLDKAQVAAERGNYDYAINLYHQLLDLEPTHLDARRLLREVEVRKSQDQGVAASSPAGWIKGAGALVTALVFMLFRKYEKAMSACEAFLKKDPYNKYVLRLLAKAAEKAEFYEVAILVNEDVRARYGSPTSKFAIRLHTRMLRNLGELYVQVEKLPKAAECYEEVLRLLPHDREGERRIRDIAARRSMAEGGWDKAGQQGGYRQVLKNEAQSMDLEASQRDIRTRQDVLDAIERVKSDLAGDTENTRLLIQLGDYYRMLRDWDTASATYEKAQAIDPTNFLIQQRLGDIRLARMDEEIGQVREQEPDNKERLTELLRKRTLFALEEYEKRVRARPQDLPTRYAYGSILLRVKRYKEASVQFQHASRDPKTRRPSLYRLGLCFQRQGLVDLAIEQFGKAVTGASIVDQEVKDVLYALAEAHESQGRVAEALDAYKRIFEVDINFKDVSAKIESLYKQGAREAT